MRNWPHSSRRWDRHRHWRRRTLGAPKGFLRYYVLKRLKEKPMSGSEIMKEIEKETSGRWKPSPSSVYPLLAWFQDGGYIKELPKDESGMKRYILTEKGERFFEEQEEMKGKRQEKFEFLFPLLFGEFWPDKLRELRKPFKGLFKALFDLRVALEKNFTEQALKDAREFLNSTIEKVKEMTNRLGEGK